MKFLSPDVEGESAVIERVAAVAAVPSFDMHNGFAQVVLAKKEGVDVGAIESLGEDLLST